MARRCVFVRRTKNTTPAWSRRSHSLLRWVPQCFHLYKRRCVLKANDMLTDVSECLYKSWMSKQMLKAICGREISGSATKSAIHLQTSQNSFMSYIAHEEKPSFLQIQQLTMLCNIQRNGGLKLPLLYNLSHISSWCIWSTHKGRHLDRPPICRQGQPTWECKAGTALYWPCCKWGGSAWLVNMKAVYLVKTLQSFSQGSVAEALHSRNWVHLCHRTHGHVSKEWVPQSFQSKMLAPSNWRENPVPCKPAIIRKQASERNGAAKKDTWPHGKLRKILNDFQQPTDKR